MSVVAGWLSSIWAKLALVGAVALALLGVYAAIRKGGGDAQRAKDLAAGAAVKRRMDDAEARGPRTRDDVVDSLRKHDF